MKIYHVLTQDENIPADFPIFYKGRLSKIVIKKIVKAIISEVNSNIEYYLCGPHQFMQLVEEAIRSIDGTQPKIFKEQFFIPDQKSLFDPSTLPDREIVLWANSDRYIIKVAGGKSILRASLENNIPVRYSCTEGQCGSCRAKLITGQVKLRKNHALTEDELGDGQILLCQGLPMSDGIEIKASV
jgi:ring-1,2-phenylacetyl-CoA epoxidase subunit PaaE